MPVERSYADASSCKICRRWERPRYRQRRQRRRAAGRERRDGAEGGRDARLRGGGGAGQHRRQEEAVEGRGRVQAAKDGEDLFLLASNQLLERRGRFLAGRLLVAEKSGVAGRYAVHDVWPMVGEG